MAEYLGVRAGDRDLFDGLDAAAGGRIRALREAHGISQSRLAYLINRRYDLNWHQTTVGKVEAGERPLRLSEAFAICITLNTTLEELTLGRQGGEQALGALAGAERELWLIDHHLQERFEEISARRRLLQGGDSEPELD